MKIPLRGSVVDAANDYFEMTKILVNGYPDHQVPYVPLGIFVEKFTLGKSKIDVRGNLCIMDQLFRVHPADDTTEPYLVLNLVSEKTVLGKV